MDSSFSLTNLVGAAICFLALWCTIFIFYTEVVVKVLNRFFILPMFCSVTNIRKSRSHQENKTMASSSSLTDLAPPSSLPKNWKHHVFPSFHGADVRTNFLSHVLKEFRSKGIDLFIDNNIERSKSISPELIEAIRGSRIATVFLTKNYASSTWCLNELVEIMKCREELGQTVMSIFYDVDPTDVKKQTGDFGKAFTKNCKGKRKEEIRRWKHALMEVAQIAGHHATNWKTEAQLIEDIATDVSNKLNLSAPCNDFDGLVGMESHMTEMKPLLRLDSDEVRKIGILGPRGIGKTTIARFLFNRHSPDFQLSVFMGNIRKKYATTDCSDDYSLKLDLQKQFMSQLTNERGIMIPHLGVIKDRLKDKKVLVVLDDVDRSVQLEAIAKETCWFGPGSRIIITTQDEKVLKASGINHIHKVKLPSYHEALQMFFMYAFGKKDHKDGFKELAYDVVSHVDKLPLGLRVMGSYFRGMSEKYWTEALPRLKTHLDRDEDIASILKFTYDTLDDEEKSLFLHIACFFNGEKVDIVEGSLAEGFCDVTRGLHSLAEKYLIQLEVELGYIHMSELLVQLGRKIVREEYVSEPGKRQFLHDPIDIGEVLGDDKAGSSNVIGIYFNYVDITCTSERAFERLSNLQFLVIESRGKINRSQINPRIMNYISQKLRVLRWWGSELTSFPYNFNPKFLVKLHMQCSGLEKLWDDIKPLNNLKLMDLRYSRSLKELPDLSTATNLYDLNLGYCSSLVELPSSIGNAVNLKKMDLTHCGSLVELPFSIGNAVNLVELNLSHCSSLVELPFSIGNAVNLQKLNFSHCSSLVELPSSIGNAINLKILSLKGCSSLVELPFSIGNAIYLKELNLSHCSSLVELPFSIKNVTNLEYLNLSYCSNLVELPYTKFEVLKRSLLKRYLKSSEDTQELPDSWIGRISRLRRLVLSGMKNLVSLPPLPDSVVELDAEDCESLERLGCSFHNPDILLNFANCYKLNEEARDLIIHTPTSEYAVFPAGEVPQCFTYRSYGSSLIVKLKQMPIGTSTKFKACIICTGEYVEEKGFRDFVIVSCHVESGGNTVTSDRKIVRSLFPGHLYTFEVEVETEMLTSTELLFEFSYSEHLTYFPAPDFKVEEVSKVLEIKECGILQLLEIP